MKLKYSIFSQMKTENAIVYFICKMVDILFKLIDAMW